MSTQVVAWRTVDGEFFLTQREADKHEMYVARLEVIKNFLAGPENTLRNVADHQKALEFVIAWEEYRKTH